MRHDYALYKFTIDMDVDKEAYETIHLSPVTANVRSDAHTSQPIAGFGEGKGMLGEGE